MADRAKEYGDGWLKARALDHDVWAIDDKGQDTLYLVAGSERALLVDTGWGVGDLPGLARSLTDLPLVVANSHGHPDHACGNGQFPLVHISREDEVLVRKPLPLKNRRWISTRMLPHPLPAGFRVERWAASVPALVTIEDGHTFDLGGRTLEAILVPGHTRGSLCFLDHTNRLLLTGDAILGGPIWLQLEESTPLSEFLASLRRLQGYAGAFDRLLPAHGATLLPGSVLGDLISGIEGVLAGRVAGVKEKTFAGDGLRCDFGSCGIVYRPDRL